MLNFDLNNVAVFAGTTVNGVDLAVVVGRDHRCLPPRAHLDTIQPSGKRLITAYPSTTPAATPRLESERMSMRSIRSRRWQQVTAAGRTLAAAAPANGALLNCQQAL